MRKLGLLFVPFLVVSCETSGLEEQIPAKQEENLQEIVLDGEINQQYVSRVTDAGFSNGDRIGMYAVNYDNGVAGELSGNGNQVNNVYYEYDAPNNAWTPAYPVYYKNAETPVDIYGYYPYCGEIATPVEYKFSVQKDQSKLATEYEPNGYEASDLLWAKAENIMPTNARVNLRFGHILSCVKVVLQEGSGFEEDAWDALSKNVILLNTIRKANVDLSTGVATTIGEPSYDGIVMSIATDGFRAITIPQTISQGTELLAITIDNVSYKYTAKAQTVLEAGKLTTYTLEVNYVAATGDYEFSLVSTEITDWTVDTETNGGEARQYIVVNKTFSQSLEETLASTNRDASKIKNLKIVGEVSHSDIYYMRDVMKSLQHINMKESVIENDIIPQNAFSNTEIISFVFPDRMSMIEREAFNDCKYLSGALIIPNGVTTIGNSAFRSTNISSLTLPEGLQRIEGSSFSSCKSLSGMVLFPESLKYIGNYAFDLCGSISSINMPENLTFLGMCAFRGCEQIRCKIKIPKTITSIEWSVFSGCKNLSIELHDGITQIGSEAFRDCNINGELILPQMLRGIEDWAFLGTKISSIVFNDNLINIKDSAFSWCSNLTEVVLPESLLGLGKSVFAECYSLKKVVIPSNIASLNSVFSGCPITTIICNATDAPLLYDEFTAVDKSKCVLEVPGQSLVKYQVAPIWKDFANKTAHYNFSVSVPCFRAMNAETTREITLQAPANYSWSIEDKPDWVTVSPTSGTGPCNLTVTIGAMAHGEAEVITNESGTTQQDINGNALKGRVGEVVFLLDGKDYRTKLSVEQYDYEDEDGDVHVKHRASAGCGVNIVVMGNCFDAFDIAMGNYKKALDEAVEHFFAVEPYNTYRDYFNVYTVVGVSPDSGKGTPHAWRESKFSDPTATNLNERNCFQYACRAETVNEDNINKTLIIIAQNSTDADGDCYMWEDGSAVAICPTSTQSYPYDYRGVVQHNACGHGFGKLADEWVTKNAFVPTQTSQTISELKAKGWYKNIAVTHDFSLVDWAHLINNPNYSNYVDIFEGACDYTRGVYTSEATSCMDDCISYFSTISRQAIVERIKEYAGEGFDINDFFAHDVAGAARVSSLQHKAATTGQTNPIPQRNMPKIMKGRPQF